MSADRGRRTGLYDLHNDTRLNVATLLQEPVGSSREVRFNVETLPLDAEVSATGIEGVARLTRLQAAVLARATARGEAEIECARCVRLYDQSFVVEFAEEFRQTVDVHSGQELTRHRGSSADADQDEDEPGFAIDENHELDLAEALRQWIVLALPMRPDCGPDCAGPEMAGPNDQEAVDSRLASLADLLPDADRG